MGLQDMKRFNDYFCDKEEEVVIWMQQLEEQSADAKTLHEKQLCHVGYIHLHGAIRIHACRRPPMTSGPYLWAPSCEAVALAGLRAPGRPSTADARVQALACGLEVTKQCYAWTVSYTAARKGSADAGSPPSSAPAHSLVIERELRHDKHRAISCSSLRPPHQRTLQSEGVQVGTSAQRSRCSTTIPLEATAELPQHAAR